MQLVIYQNKIEEVDKVDKDLVDKSVTYRGFDLKGNPIIAYDTESGKLKPIVRDLIEEEGGTSNLRTAIFIIGGIILLFILGTVFLGGKKDPIPQVQQVGIPIVKETKIIEKEKEIVPIENNNKINELEQLKYQSDLETIRLTYAKEELGLKNYKLQQENNILIEENKKLTDINSNLVNNNKDLINKLNIKKIRELNYPKDAFIYYLGDNVYKKCENANTSEINDNCKTLYYNYLKNE